MAHEILTPVYERRDDRGAFLEVLNSGRWESLICGRMNPGSVIGNHYHKRTEVFLYLAAGRAAIRTVHVETGDSDDFRLHSGQGVLLPPGESHGIRFLEESEIVMLKSHRYDEADPDIFPFPVQD